MSEFEVLRRYVHVADMTDLRVLATEYAVEMNWECLEIVTDEIEKRTALDMATTKNEMDRNKENEGSPDKPKTIKSQLPTSKLVGS